MTTTQTVPTKPFDEALEYISSQTSLNYLGNPGAVESIDANLPLVFYTHPLCGLRVAQAPDITPDVQNRELEFIKSLKRLPVTVVFVLGGDSYNAHAGRIFSQHLGRESYFVLSVTEQGQSSYDSGNLVLGLGENHPQEQCLVSLSKKISQVYSAGSYLDRCHSVTYANLRYLFSKTIVPLASVFARRDYKPRPKPQPNPEMTLGPMTDFWLYDWTMNDLPQSKYELSPLTLEEHLLRK